MYKTPMDAGTSTPPTSSKIPRARSHVPSFGKKAKDELGQKCDDIGQIASH